MESFSEENDVTSALRRPTSSVPRALAELWTAPPSCHDIHLPSPGLRATVEDEVIPRLVLAHVARTPVESVRGLPREVLLDAVARLADCAEAVDLGGARAICDDMLARGLSFEDVLVELLAGAATLVGWRWERDQSDFVLITMAIGCLQSLLHGLADEYRHECYGLASERRLLLIPIPGEQHAFGAAVTTEVFRRRGWNVDADALSDMASLVRRVGEEWFHVVGLSVSCDRHVPLLADAIRRIRGTSRNRRVGIMVGGHLFSQHPDLVSRVGADACCNDPLRAVGQAEQLVGLLVVHCR